MHVRRIRIMRQQPIHRISRLFEQRNIRFQISKTQQRQTRLTHTEELARAAQLQIPPRHFKTIGGLVHHF